MFHVKKLQRLRYKVKENKNKTLNQLYTPSDNHV